MEYVNPIDCEYIKNKYHDTKKPFNAFSRYIRRDEIFDESTGQLRENAKNTDCTKELISLCDVLVDGAFIEELKDIRLKFRGSANQRVIDVQKTLEKGECVLYLE
jgi:organic radical activating enzyme